MGNFSKSKQICDTDHTHHSINFNPGKCQPGVAKRMGP